jgi:hypothetical protein
MVKHNLKTLIIHPNDPTTTFLEDIYINIRNKTVITGGVNWMEINKLIQKHEHVYILGHGTSCGLLAVGQFQDRREYIVDIAMCESLREKEKCVYIWCHANRFLIENKLDGFATGMFISEIDEAYYYSMWEVTQKMIDVSNLAFSNLLAEVIDEPNELMYYLVKRDYGKLVSENPVARFNHERLYLSQNQKELLNKGITQRSRL